MAEYKDLFGGPGEVVYAGGPIKSDIIDVSPEASAALQKAMVLVAKRWKEFYEGNTNGFVHPDLTDGCAAFAFLRSKYMGVEYPRNMSMAFNPQQFETMGDAGSVLTTLERVSDGDLSQAKSLIWMLEGEANMARLVSKGGMPLHGCRLPVDFPAMTACKLYDRYCPEGGSVLDPCHGWSGRFVGFLLSRTAVDYCGVDPSPSAHDGIKKAAELLGPLADGDKSWSFCKQPYETLRTDNLFDMAFTSPPYVDVESYDGDLQSFRQYPTFDEWTEGFYVPLICDTALRLKEGGYFLLNVGSQSYPLVELAKEIASAAGLELERSRAHIVKQNRQMNTSAERGETLLVFRKA